MTVRYVLWRHEVFEDKVSFVEIGERKISVYVITFPVYASVLYEYDWEEDKIYVGGAEMCTPPYDTNECINGYLDYLEKLIRESKVLSEVHEE